MKNLDNIDVKLTKEDFVFVQEDTKLHDQALKTKPVGYFKDAMIRFGKNKTNIVATTILVILILLSIIVPNITTKNYKEVDGKLQLLPPKIPGLSSLGIADGIIKIEGAVVNPDIIDPETNLGLPVGYETNAIVEGTLTNYEITGNIKSPLYRGGTNEINIAINHEAYMVRSSEERTLLKSENPSLIIDIDKFDEDIKFEVYIGKFSDIPNYDQVVKIGETDKTGKTTINIFEGRTEESLTGTIYLRAVSTNGIKRTSGSVYLTSVEFKGTNEDNNHIYEGYELSMFEAYIVEREKENGYYIRQNAIAIMSSFKYDKYKAAFRDYEDSIGKEEYDQLLEKYPKMAESMRPDPDNPGGFIFDDGFPLKKVVSISQLTIGGTTYYTYVVVKDGALAVGNQTNPHFWFGTDDEGRDLFALIWLGLRTSLLLGLIASIINVSLGILYGSISGYYGGKVDLFMQRFSELWVSFPQIAIIGIVSAVVGPGFTSLLILLVYDGWVGISGITRVQFYRYKGREYVLAARTLGARDLRLIFRHILPNGLGTIITRSILSIPGVIFFETTLSYLGFGVGDGQTLKIGFLELTGTSIGVILSKGQSQILSPDKVYLVLFPTIVIAILMITFNMFGNALRDAFNPTLRGSE